MEKKSSNNTWNPRSWQKLKAEQQPVYPDKRSLDKIINDLSRLPPIVTSWEIDELTQQISKAQLGEAFILQGGDCAETFIDCTSEIIVAKIKILLQMSIVMLHGIKKPIVRIGRLAGQYAKPRSADTEKKGGNELPSYRGDLVNSSQFTIEDRVPDPKLLLRGYERSALTMNFIRSLIDGGFTDLHHPEYWDLSWLGHSKMADKYHEIVQSISQSVDFIESVSGRPLYLTQRADIYAAHEGLHLLYEQAQTRYIKRTNSWYNLTTHFPWIGMRTAGLSGAHVEYFKGISNPIGIKIGPGMTSKWLASLLKELNPESKPGRITLIHRFGVDKIEKILPNLIKTVISMDVPVLWVCDPMHGNTEISSNGRKTRRFGKITKELKKAFKIHEQAGSYLGGVHLELTGENVTECTGGARGLVDDDLEKAYKTSVDPRLNYEQAMEIAFDIGGFSN